ncbi:alpha-1,2-fucosyltransferase [Lactococcus lactis]|jgi:hypothetical protein|uniref:alpha-1,2-fucosyltransferase n=1 Tax=Lactococcus lactis TaxID=1358 RepID=UPI00206396A6|nr:alpha-1,2-fucosyltransferase [Lactococcus lactis]WKF73363.1 alpha-1,2-fucosyltransferase [Lactococcus lactis]BDH80523.1 alpha-1,2-fucosyltransferase [Lactococcus lactis]
MKNIIVNATGRLGNQFFQYSYAKKIQKATGGSITINFKEIEQKAELLPNQDWKDSLKDFNTNYEKVSFNRLQLLSHLSFIQKILIVFHTLFIRTILKKDNLKNYDELNNFSKKYANYLYKRGLYVFPMMSVKYISSNHDKILLMGKYEDPESLDEIKDELRLDFIPQAPILEQNRLFYEKISSTQSVCITIRRGDYLSNKFKDDFFQCDEEYFSKGIKIIKQKVTNPVFFFFSDDLEYAKKFAENYLEDSDEYYVENPDNPIWEKVRIMSKCKYFIISNSTFSWWVQFLGDYENKIVIGPRQWYPQKSTNKSNNLVQENWIKI